VHQPQPPPDISPPIGGCRPRTPAPAPPPPLGGWRPRTPPFGSRLAAAGNIPQRLPVGRLAAAGWQVITHSACRPLSLGVERKALRGPAGSMVAGAGLRPPFSAPPMSRLQAGGLAPRRPSPPPSPPHPATPHKRPLFHKGGGGARKIALVARIRAGDFFGGAKRPGPLRGMNTCPSGRLPAILLIGSFERLVRRGYAP